MTNMLKISAAVAALLVAATPAAAQQVSPDSQARATARIVKPLSLYWVQDLDLGSIILGPGTWSGAVVGVGRDGTPDCANTNVTCTGTMTEAQYRVTGTNNQDVTVNASASIDLVHTVDPTQVLAMSVDNPGTVSLGNSGVPGLVFGLGGSITVDATTVDGTYTGLFDVTVEY